MRNADIHLPAPRLPGTRLAGALRRLARPSSVVRALWLAVVALHTWLVLRRVACGEWGSALDALRGALGAGGVLYGALKFWKIATIFDNAPRRALAFTLVLLLGHWLLATPAQSAAAGGSSGVVAVLIAAPALGATLALTGRAVRPVAARNPVALPNLIILYAEYLPLAVLRRAFFLFRRPPPLAC